MQEGAQCDDSVHTHTKTIMHTCSQYYVYKFACYSECECEMCTE